MGRTAGTEGEEQGEPYCDMLPGNASVICGFWSLYIDLLDKSSGGITVNYNPLNLTIIILR
jgi:hypothetical protein